MSRTFVSVSVIVCSLIATAVVPHTARALELELVKDINLNGAGTCSSPRSITESGGITFFAASDCVAGDELWRTDGTSAGTVMGCLSLLHGLGLGAEPA